MNRRNSTQPSEGPATAVRARTLSEALRLTRLRFGQDVRVVCSREVSAAAAADEPPRRLVEVVVVPARSGRRRALGERSSAPREAAAADEHNVATDSGAERSDRRTAEPTPDDAAQQSALEEAVTRIERTIKHLESRPGTPVAEVMPHATNRFSRALLAAGTTPQLVARLGERFVAETGGSADDEYGLQDYLLGSLATGEGDWALCAGAHAFLGPAGSGKSAVVYEAAARRQATGGRTLVLSVAPGHPGEIKRLQRGAAQYGYDGAVVTDPRRLTEAIARRGEYDSLLIDTPSLTAPGMGEGGELHDAIVQNADLQRHFVVPVDIDVQDATPLWTTARDWHCDWLVLTRLDRTSRPGKLLDLCAAAQLPVSLLGEGEGLDGRVRPATNRALCGVILATGDPDDFCDGRESAAGALA